MRILESGIRNFVVIWILLSISQAFAQVEIEKESSTSVRERKSIHVLLERHRAETRQLEQQLDFAKSEMKKRQRQERKDLSNKQGKEEALLRKSEVVEKAQLEAKHEGEKARAKLAGEPQHSLWKKHKSEWKNLGGRLSAAEDALQDRHKSEKEKLDAKQKIERAELDKQHAIRRAELDAKHSIEKLDYYAGRGKVGTGGRTNAAESPTLTASERREMQRRLMEIKRQADDLKRKADQHAKTEAGSETAVEKRKALLRQKEELEKKKAHLEQLLRERKAQEPSIGEHQNQQSYIPVQVTDRRRGENDDNCVLFARSQVPSLPYGLGTWESKRNVINSKSPTVGSVAIIAVPSGTYAQIGHVAIVEKVTPNSITILEANYSGPSIQRRTSIATDIQTATQQLNIVGYFQP